MIAITIKNLRLRLRRPGRLLVDWRRRSAGGHAAGGADFDGEESPPRVIEYNGRDGGDIEFTAYLHPLIDNDGEVSILPKG